MGCSWWDLLCASVSFSFASFRARLQSANNPDKACEIQFPIKYSIPAPGHPLSGYRASPEDPHCHEAVKQMPLERNTATAMVIGVEIALASGSLLFVLLGGTGNSYPVGATKHEANAATGTSTLLNLLASVALSPIL